jgi:CBS domain
MTARSDTAAAVAAHRDQSHRESDITPVSPPRPRRLLVEDVMSRDVVTVAPTATFHQMIGLMRRREVSALPVVDDNGTLLGIVSEADLLAKESPPRRAAGGCLRAAKRERGGGRPAGWSPRTCCRHRRSR